VDHLFLYPYSPTCLTTTRIYLGKTSTPTSPMTAVIQQVIYYPYWNVPFSIATTEMLPKLKRNSHYLDNLKIQVMRGSYIYASSTMINWKNYSQRNFPFSFRQLPGCHNSLGRLKFDFENPYNTYLHDTNDKTAFRSTKRFLSHGCIRVEKPYDLALSLGLTADQVNMDSCQTGLKPSMIPIKHAVPIFIIYATVDVVDGNLRWYEDAYHKLDELSRR
jgi:L,D-transpeptidase YcbB